MPEYLYFCLTVCLSICMSVYLCVYLSVCLPICISIYLLACLPACLSIRMFVSLYVSDRLCLFFFLTSTFLPVCLLGMQTCSSAFPAHQFTDIFVTLSVYVRVY